MCSQHYQPPLHLASHQQRADGSLRRSHQLLVLFSLTAFSRVVLMRERSRGRDRPRSPSQESHTSLWLGAEQTQWNPELTQHLPHPGALRCTILSCWKPSRNFASLGTVDRFNNFVGSLEKGAIIYRKLFRTLQCTFSLNDLCNFGFID